MTVDERLARLAEMTEMIAAQTIENARLAKEVQQAQKRTEEAQRKTQLILADVLGSVRSLTRVAKLHDSRLNGHERRIEKLERPRKK